MMTPFMKCDTWRGDRSLRYAHAKLDGHRVRVTRGKVMRKIEDVTERCENAPFIRAVRALDPSWVIEGELWVPGEPAAAVSNRLAEHSDGLLFSAFCAGHLPNDWPLEMLEIELGERGFDFAPYCPIVHFSFETMTAMQRAARVGQRFEGWVFKNGNWLDWQKWKPTLTIDLVVTSFKDGKGKHEGFVGSLECSAEGHVIANVSGMDDEVRWMIDEQKDLGRVVEVKYDRVDARGRLRFPRFVRWRDDKQAGECTLDQDPELKEKHGC